MNSSQNASGYSQNPANRGSPSSTPAGGSSRPGAMPPFGSSASYGGLKGSSSSGPSKQPQKVLESNRLFIGNLSPSVDEYTLIQVFSKCGKVVKMDFLFHKSGPLRGKPRGYAFVEYDTREAAQKAVDKLHDRMLRGKSLVVTPASVSNFDPTSMAGKPYRRSNEPAKTTTLSLLKNQKRPQSTEAQIAALEAKLHKMKGSPHATASSSAPPPGSNLASRSGSASVSAAPNESPLSTSRSASEAHEEMEMGADALLDSVAEEMRGVSPSRSLEVAVEQVPERTGSMAPAALQGVGLPVKPSAETISAARTLERQGGGERQTQ